MLADGLRRASARHASAAVATSGAAAPTIAPKLRGSSGRRAGSSPGGTGRRTRCRARSPRRTRRRSRSVVAISAGSRRHDVVRVHEVDEGAVVDARAGAAGSWRLRIWFQPMCGTRQLGVVALAEAHAAAGQDAEPAHRAELLALLEQQLHAEADAEERRAALDDPRARRRPGRSVRRLSMQAPKAPTPGSTTPAARLDARRVARDLAPRRRRARSPSARCAGCPCRSR